MKKKKLTQKHIQSLRGRRAKSGRLIRKDDKTKPKVRMADEQ